MPTPSAPDADPRPPLGHLLQTWRRRRGRSQLALALAADVSQRHLSFVESGRSRPSRDMVLRLAGELNVPLRERNRLLLAAGFAPHYPERPLHDPALGAARAAVERVLAAHEPFPALAVDRSWCLVTANRAVAPLLAGAAAALLAPPVNVLRLSLHPDGLTPRVINYAEWRVHLLERLRAQVVASGDETLAALHDELRGYPPPRHAARSVGRPPAGALDGAGVFVPLRLAVGACSRGSARPRCSARRSTSRSPSWRWSASARPTPCPPSGCAARSPNAAARRAPAPPFPTRMSTTVAIAHASAATRDVVHAILARLAAGDLDGLAALFAPAIEWQLSWPDAALAGAVPWIRPRSTPDDVRAHFETLAAYNVPHGAGTVVDRVVVDGPDAVLTGTIRNVLRRPGAVHAATPYQAHFALHLAVEGGRIRRYRIYEDSLAVVDAWRAAGEDGREDPA